MELQNIIAECFEKDDIDTLVKLDEDRDTNFEMDQFKDEDGKDFFLQSVANDCEKCMKYCIETLDWSFDSMDYHKNNALHLAKSLNIVKYLVEKFKVKEYSIMTCYNRNNKTPYIFACERGKLDIVKYFDSIGCYFYMNGINRGINAYMAASFKGHLDVMTYLDKKWNDKWKSSLCLKDYKLIIDTAENNNRVDIIHYLRRRKYKRKFREISCKNNECYICLEEFSCNSKTSTVVCENGHYFHTECYINNLVHTNKDICVVCKQKMLNYKFIKA